jgi:hypothetical protein
MNVDAAGFFAKNSWPISSVPFGACDPPGGGSTGQVHHHIEPGHHFRRSSTSRPDWLKIAFNVPFLSSSWRGTEKRPLLFEGQRGFLLAF